MWNRISRQTYGYVCLAVFVAIALVACETPAPGVAAPTVSEELADISSLAVGTTRNVGLSKAFKGEKLRFSVRSNNLDVSAPTVAADNRSIVIRAIGAGTATITVTATNSGGSVSQSFKVTVPPPQQPPPQQDPPTTTPDGPTLTDHSNCESPLEIIRGRSAECTLTNDHSLVYEGEQELVSVRGPDSSATTNVWTITALLKGRPVIQIRDDETGATVAEITVIVPNTPPRRVTAELPNLTMADAADDGDGHLHQATLTGLDSAFTDDDKADVTTGDPSKGFFNYKVQHQPDELLITTMRGFLSDEVKSEEVTIEAVVLKPFTEEFSIEIYAYDRDNDRSDSPVTAKFTASTTTPVDPREGTYVVKQKDNGDFEPVRIGNRLDTRHTLEFRNAAGAAAAPFEFARDHDSALKQRVSGKIYLAPNATVNENDPAVCADNKVPDMLAVNAACYTYTTTNKVAIAAATDFTAGVDPEIIFELPSSRNGLNSGTATITIKYHVGAYKDRQDHGSLPDPAPLTKVHTDSESLTINIHKCVVTTDCPIE